jgi:hypothetical protein
VPHGTGLAGNPATDHGNVDIESLGGSGEAQRLEKNSLVNIAPTEIVASRSAVDEDLAIAGIEPDTGNR